MLVLRRRVRSDVRDLSLLAAGTLVGFVAGVLLSGRSERTKAGRAGTDERRPISVGWDRLGRAWEGTLEGLATVREWRRTQRPVDLDALTDRIREVPGGEAVAVYSLGPGIVELVGTAPSDEDAADLLALAEEHEGVHTVVNRIWTAGVILPSE